MPNSPKPGTATRSFRAPNTLWAAVQERAAQDGILPTEVVRQALEAYTMTSTQRHCACQSTHAQCQHCDWGTALTARAITDAAAATHEQETNHEVCVFTQPCDTQATTDTANRTVNEAKQLRAELTRQPTTTSLRDAVEWANSD